MSEELPLIEEAQGDDAEPDSVEPESVKPEELVDVPAQPTAGGSPVGPDLPLLTYLLKKYAVETLPAGVHPVVVLAHGRDFYYLSPLNIESTHLLLARVLRHMEG